MNPSAGAPSPEQYAKGLRADNEANTFIAKRHEQRERAGEPKSAQAIWRESEGRYDARRREENRTAWCEYHQEQAERHRAVERHQDRCYHEPQLRGG